MEQILYHFHRDNDISAETIAAIQNDGTLRKDLIDFSRQNENRAFALSLLNKFIMIRKQNTNAMPAENLMFACFNLGLQNQIEDCLKIWEAKNIDFDTYCGFDIQLLPFAGVDKTMEFLKLQTSTDAEEALSYLTKCADYGDFDDQDNYFSPQTPPWFL